MVLLIDNYDSFSYNLVQLVGKILNEQGSEEVKVIRNDDLTVKEIDELNPRIIILSPGPGRPSDAGVCEDVVRELGEKYPILGICLGHQLLSNAFGYPTYKLKFGQHGSNHPVQNLRTGAVEITSQNHNYNVPEEIANVAHITHRNLFDNTIEGVEYKDAPIFSVQHHPESSAGPHESEYLFAQFLKAL